MEYINIEGGRPAKTISEKRTYIDTDGIKERINKIKKYLSDAQNNAGKALFDLSVFDPYKGVIPINPQSVSILASIEERYNTMRSDTLGLYRLLTEPFFKEEYAKQKERPNDIKNEAIGHENFLVEACVSDDKLFVRLPILWSRYQAYRSAAGKIYSKDYTDFLVPELRKTLENLSEIESIPFLTMKHFHYLFAIKKSQNSITDNDNYDTKLITDTISLYLNCSDAARDTSFSFMTVTDTLIPEGTYVIVTDSFNKPMSATALIDAILASNLISKKQQ